MALKTAGILLYNTWISDKQCHRIC